MSISPTDPRIEKQYYSDRLREQGIKECEWHEGLAAWPECPECQAMYEVEQENQMDMMREER